MDYDVDILRVERRSHTFRVSCEAPTMVNAAALAAAADHDFAQDMCAGANKEITRVAPVPRATQEYAVVLRALVPHEKTVTVVAESQKMAEHIMRGRICEAGWDLDEWKTRGWEGLWAEAEELHVGWLR